MLVLSRKNDEEVIFDGPGSMKILEITGNRVRIGFTGNRETTKFLRAELVARLRTGEIIKPFDPAEPEPAL